MTYVSGFPVRLASSAESSFNNDPLLGICAEESLTLISGIGCLIGLFSSALLRKIVKIDLCGELFFKSFIKTV